jgi:hypothetical protein
MNAVRMLFLSGALALGSMSAAAYGADVDEALPDTEPSAIQSGRPLSLAALELRLRQTHAIGVMEKLTLKYEIAGLMASFRVAHESGTPEVRSLRLPYDTLVSKIKSLLKRDPQLASDISESRESIWNNLADRQKFASRG